MANGLKNKRRELIEESMDSVCSDLRDAIYYDDKNMEEAYREELYGLIEEAESMGANVSLTEEHIIVPYCDLEWDD